MSHPFGSTTELQEKFITIFKGIGVITQSCENAGISRSTFHRWLENDGKFPADFNDSIYETFGRHKELWRQIPENRQNIFIWGAFELEKDGIM